MVSLTHVPDVPKGRLRIARHFSGGNMCVQGGSPVRDGWAVKRAWLDARFEVFRDCKPFLHDLPPLKWRAIFTGAYGTQTHVAP
jgi:hypothetical protein